MFQIGDVVFHLQYGVCQITDMKEENFLDEKKMYYLLHAIDEKDRSVIYIPVERIDEQVRKVYTPEQIDGIIADSVKEQVEWIENNNFRKMEFNQILKSGDISKTIAMICCIYTRKKLLEEKGKKLTSSDENVLTQSQRKIHQEFAYSLHMEEEDIPKYIVSRIEPA